MTAEGPAGDEPSGDGPPGDDPPPRARPLTPSAWDHVGAGSGMLFALLLFVSLQVSGDQGVVRPGDPAANIAANLARHRDAARTGSRIALLAVVFLLLFVAHLRRQLQQAEGEDGWMASAAYGGGVAGAALLLVSAANDLARSVLGAYGPDAQVAKTLLVQGWDQFLVVGVPMAVFVGAASVVMVRFGLYPAWMGWAGAVTAVVLLTPVPFVGLLLLALWVVAVSGASLVESLRGRLLAPPAG